MIEMLLALIALLLWFFLRPEKDWYVVEWRFCTDEALCHIAFPVTASGFDKGSLAAHNLWITYRGRDQGRVKVKEANGGEIRIHQYVFASLDAARIHFDRLRDGSPFGEDFQKLYLYRIVARSRRKAITLPPEMYDAKSGEILLQHPQFMWTNPCPSMGQSVTDSGSE